MHRRASSLDLESGEVYQKAPPLSNGPAGCQRDRKCVGVSVDGDRTRGRPEGLRRPGEVLAPTCLQVIAVHVPVGIAVEARGARGARRLPRGRRVELDRRR